jgi:hypothetical protein
VPRTTALASLRSSASIRPGQNAVQLLERQVDRRRGVVAVVGVVGGVGERVERALVKVAVRRRQPSTASPAPPPTPPALPLDVPLAQLGDEREHGARHHLGERLRRRRQRERAHQTREQLERHVRAPQPRQVRVAVGERHAEQRVPREQRSDARRRALGQRVGERRVAHQRARLGERRRGAAHVARRRAIGRQRGEPRADERVQPPQRNGRHAAPRLLDARANVERAEHVQRRRRRQRRVVERHDGVKVLEHARPRRHQQRRRVVGVEREAAVTVADDAALVATPTTTRQRGA